ALHARAPALRPDRPPAVRRRGLIPSRLPRAPARHPAPPGRRLDTPVGAAAAGSGAAGRRRPSAPRRSLPRSALTCPTALTWGDVASLQVRVPGRGTPTDSPDPVRGRTVSGERAGVSCAWM